MLLDQQGTDPNIRTNNSSTPLHYACPLSCHESVQMLLEYNANPNCQDSDGNTPLHNIIGHGTTDTSVECVRTLLEQNANVNIKNKNGETPLLAAVSNYHIVHDIDSISRLAFVELLLTSGADVNVQFSALYVIGDTPLHSAIRNLDPKVVQMILSFNPDLKILNSNSQTALDVAKYYGRNEIIKYIEDQLYKTRCQMYFFMKRGVIIYWKVPTII